jgi:hypothetical protein
MLPGIVNVYTAIAHCCSRGCNKHATSTFATTPAATTASTQDAQARYRTKISQHSSFGLPIPAYQATATAPLAAAAVLVVMAIMGAVELLVVLDLSCSLEIMLCAELHRTREAIVIAAWCASCC